MSIKIKDLRLTTIVSKDAIVETISDEFEFTEAAKATQTAKPALPRSGCGPQPRVGALRGYPGK